MSTSTDTRSALLKASTPPSKDFFNTLVIANHILHHNHVVDAFGHISARNPQNPHTFFLSRSLAPALVSRDDIQEYHVSDASPVSKGRNMPKAFLERHIHSEIYKAYKDVNSVVHSHHDAVIPCGLGSVPLKAVHHMGGVIGTQVPVFDIGNHYKPSDEFHSLLVTNEHLGAGLAAGFNPTGPISKVSGVIKSYLAGSESTPVAYPSCPVVLMRGHGFTNVGATIEEAVYRAIYTCRNAQIQTTSLSLQMGFNLRGIAHEFGKKEHTSGAKQEDIKYLSEREVRDSWAQIRGVAERAWELWSAEVSRVPLYDKTVEERQ
ncbi:hypothetical protein CERZMDRAFT_66440 [Cercospora zeae-maydis SCOH1-5]|uniref:Class II aldolase/adducin N-terminal domain-containing protein n=1 Tax=Cercospora zeae-maydis SCOH1-5 TaxID=717836 RepID=A0A6A6FLL9_9PEZI|nr:hypothetical protein CERZMDRAFT_66440 [Cercospora zeae-maydis SCOH1-5]